MINETFGSAILVQYCCSSLIIANTIFQVLISGAGFVGLVKAIFYLYGSILEIFLYCHFGNEITEKVIN